MLKVYIPSPIPGIRLLPFLAPGPLEDTRLFQSIPFSAYEGLVEPVGPEEAEYVLMPHEYSILKRDGHADGYIEEARRLKKRLIIMAYQDDPTPITLPDAIIFRPSVYKKTKLPNEIVMPAFVEDIGEERKPLLPKGIKATVGFAGKAGFADLREALRYVLRNYLLRHGADREGVYFRRHALASLRTNPRVVLTEIIRKHFSGNVKTIEVSPEEARRTYLATMFENLFTLAPRGDGNYSLRFFETLSAGRIPILIDTDVSLPLEDRIAYDSFMLRIPQEHVAETGIRTASFFDSLSEQNIAQMQSAARRAFVDYLYLPQFFRTTLTREYLEAIPHGSL